jgi:hypothetical protein
MEQMVKGIKKRWRILDEKERAVVGIVLALILLGIASAVYAGVRSSSNEEVADQSQPEQSDQDSVSETETLPESDQKPEPIEREKTNVSPLSGKQCENHNKRPFASMMAADTNARPLSGISKADVVIEMPVLTGSVTRLMGVFVCNTPTEVGSVRSARHDFISWARAFNAVFLHWGGSQMAKEELKTGKKFDGRQIGKTPHIDATKNQNPYFRKSHVPQPHNGFVSVRKAIETAKNMGIDRGNADYRGFQFLSERQVEKRQNDTSGSVHVGFAGKYKVRWDYNPDTNRYSRYWGGALATDRSTGQPVTTKNIIVFKAESNNIQDDNGTTYNTLNMYGSGDAWVYKNGREVKATWQKKNERRSFVIRKRDTDEEMKLTPGTTFIQVIEPYQEVRWEPEE